ncbi:hypothetical protein H8E88_19160 [candidate division KSB1 bacterium]|nr:hypothetical protein [candidate division KSB1 bacterium]
MKNITRKTTVLILIMLFTISMFKSNVFAQKKFEGYWESVTNSKSTMPMAPKKTNEKQKSFYKPGKIKIINLTKNKTTILRFDKGLMWEIDDNNKTYSEMTFDQMQMEMKNAKTKMAEAMKEMDPEQREMMKKMMGGKMGAMFGDSETPMISFKNTGKKKTIKGYNCTQFLMYLGKDPMMEMWLTKKYNLGDDFIKIYQKMGLMKGKMPKNSKLNGFPILMKTKVDLGMGKMEEETIVTKIVKTGVSDKEFELPKGYKKIENQMAF